MDDTPETAKLLEQGRLSQRCPRCGLVEAGGAYCTADGTPTGPADYFSDSRKSHPRATERPTVVAGREEAGSAVSHSTAPVFTGTLGF